MAAPTQSERIIEIATPLGKDVLLLRSFTGHETLGHLFCFNLDMLSTQSDVSFDDIVGQNVTVRLTLQGGGERYFNGFINSFAQTGVGRKGTEHYSIYEATMVPWFWFLTRTADCRIFQEKTVPDIIKLIFSENGFSSFMKDKLTGTYEPWVYCVQYRETAFNFISRLMEQEGIYYFFEHENGKHSLVMSDAPSAHQPFPKYESIAFRPPGEIGVEAGHIREWTMERSVRTGKFVHTDYNFIKPRTPMLQDPLITPPADMTRGHEKADYEVFDYPGEYDVMGRGQNYGQVRIQELQAEYELHEGMADSRGVAPGFKFTLEEHPRGDQNKEYLVHTAQYNVTTAQYETGTEEADEFSCSFVAIPGDAQFRSERSTPKPTVQGTQTAVVVGPKGEEIYTDEYGRIKVQFHWDRYGKYDDKSSCWIRVAHNWSGKKWGFLYLPRLGQEVVVSFLEGDPDQPLVVGSVYNKDQAQHYALPGEKTKSYIKSNSSKGGAGYNELRFEDKAGEEQIFLHGQKDLDIRIQNDAREWIIHERHLIVGCTKKPADQREMVFKDKHLKIKKNQEEHIGGDMKLMVGGIDGPGNQDIVIKKDKKELIENDSHVHVKNNRMEKVDVDQSLTVGNNQQEKVGIKHALEAGQEIHLKAGMKVIIEAGLQISLVGPGGFIDIGPAGVTIQGVMVKINSGGAAGQGSGSNPTEPKDAQPAVPIEPDEADDSKTGQKSL